MLAALDVMDTVIGTPISFLLEMTMPKERSRKSREFGKVGQLIQSNLEYTQNWVRSIRCMSCTAVLAATFGVIAKMYATERLL